jgi:outer membrane translocation and assembly module TamA
MNTQKNVNQRLSKLYTQDAKQELSSEKIELALVDDAAKALNDFVQLRKKAADDIDNAYVYLRRMQSAAREAAGEIAKVASYAQELRKAEGNVETKLDKVRSMARELGIDISSDVIDLNTYNTTIKLSDDLQKDAANFVKFMNRHLYQNAK